MRTIDLRSDTVTLPSPAMRQAMFDAPLGDDVYGEDPTVNRLERLAAERTGKEAAVFVASGTMGNLCGVMAHCGRGEEALLGDESHIYHYEGGGASVLGSVVLHPLPTNSDGTITLNTIEAAIRPAYDAHQALTKLICLENTHNRCGGVVVPPSYMAKVHAFAKQRGMSVHLDGARVFNAAVALGQDVRAITDHVDSVQFCLSKGLSAPVGSLLCGSAEVIARARRVRKMVGGGMRQAGVIAAAGIVALEQMVDRLAEDHANARMLAEGLASFAELSINLASVQTDIVIFELADPRLTVQGFVGTLAQRGLKVSGFGGRRIRAVTHYGISANDIEESLEIIRSALTA
jgi:threonine aldolase